MSLIACPFCGSARVETDRSGGEWYVLCNECECHGPFTPTESAAEARWNDRTSPERESERARLVRKLAEAGDRRDWDDVSAYEAGIAALDAAAKKPDESGIGIDDVRRIHALFPGEEGLKKAKALLSIVDDEEKKGGA